MLVAAVLKQKVEPLWFEREVGKALTDDGTDVDAKVIATLGKQTQVNMRMAQNTSHIGRLTCIHCSMV